MWEAAKPSQNCLVLTWPRRGDCIGFGVAKRIWRGRLAQLVEHLVYTERVGGSSPSPPTTQTRVGVMSMIRFSGVVRALAASLVLAGAAAPARAKQFARETYITLP